MSYCESCAALLQELASERSRRVEAEREIGKARRLAVIVAGVKPGEGAGKLFADGWKVATDIAVNRIARAIVEPQPSPSSPARGEKGQP